MATASRELLNEQAAALGQRQHAMDSLQAQLDVRLCARSIAAVAYEICLAVALSTCHHQT